MSCGAFRDRQSEHEQMALCKALTTWGTPCPEDSYHAGCCAACSPTPRLRSCTGQQQAMCSSIGAVMQHLLQAGCKFSPATRLGLHSARPTGVVTITCDRHTQCRSLHACWHMPASHAFASPARADAFMGRCVRLSVLCLRSLQRHRPIPLCIVCVVPRPVISVHNDQLHSLTQ